MESILISKLMNSLVNLNKKYLAIIVGIIIVIAVVSSVSFSKENTSLSQNLESGNQTTIHQKKNYSIELHESVGVKASP